MAANSVIMVRVLGNTSGLTKSLARAQSSLGGLDRISKSITGGMKVAGIAAAAFGAAAVGAGALGAASLAAIPAALVGVGIAFAAQNKKVKDAFSDLKGHVVGEMQSLAKPLVQPLVGAAGALKKAFDVIAPSLGRIFQATAPIIRQFNGALVPAAKQIGPFLERAFAAGVPVLKAFGAALGPIGKGFDGLIRELGKGTPQFVAFVRAFGEGLGQLLPALGRLFTALAPVGTAVLNTLVPALVTLTDWIGSSLTPKVVALSGFLKEHSTIAKGVGMALIGLVVAVKAVQMVMALASAAAMLFNGVATIVRVSIIVWKNAQLALNLAMMMNPIGLVIAAIVALVAVFVIAYKKSETFRRVVHAAWNGIKAATVAVWNFLKRITIAVWNAIKAGISNQVRAVRTVVSGVWNALKSLTRAAWNGIKNFVIRPIVAAVNAVRQRVNQAKAVMSAAWNAVKSATTRIWNGIRTAVVNAISRLMGAVRAIKGKITGVFSGAARWLWNAGKNIIGGLIDGISSMIGKVKSKLSSVTSMIPKWKGPASKDKRLLTKNGELILQGLIRGFERSMPEVRATLAGITREIGGLDANVGGRVRFEAATTTASNHQTVTVRLTADQVSDIQRGREITLALDAYSAAGGRRPR